MLTDAPRRARSMCPASELGGANGSNPSPKTLAPALILTLTLTLTRWGGRAEDTRLVEAPPATTHAPRGRGLHQHPNPNPNPITL